MRSSRYLTKRDFYDVYGISLVMRGDYLSYDAMVRLRSRLEEIASKYIWVTNRAVRDEMLHVQDATYFSFGFCESIRGREKTLSLSFIASVFAARRKWFKQYGGRSWAAITRGLIKLKTAHDNLDMCGMVMAIDHLNDLEHNTALYLRDYASFNVYLALSEKWSATEERIFKQCSGAVRSARPAALSRVAQYRVKGNV